MSVPGREHASETHMPRTVRTLWLAGWPVSVLHKKKTKKNAGSTWICLQSELGWLVFMCLLCEIAAYIMTAWSHGNALCIPGPVSVFLHSHCWVAEAVEDEELQGKKGCCITMDQH